VATSQSGRVAHATTDDASSSGGASTSSSSSSSTSTSASSAFLPRDWGKKNIDAQLQSLPPTTPVLVEFYAHWCPTCQRFAPEFEKAAKTLLEKSSSKKDDSFEIAVARVDCADEAATCVRFGVPHFPFIRFGSAADFLAKQSPELETFDGARNGKEVAAWGERKARALISKNGGGGVRSGGNGGGGAEEEALAAHPPPPPPPPALTQKQEDHTHEGAPPPPPPHPPRFDAGDVLKSTILAFRYSLDSGAVAASKGGPEAAASLAALEKFSLLLSKAHPIPSCRQGAGEMLAAIRNLSGSKKSGEAAKSLDSLRAVAVCGKGQVEPASWAACASARADGRGRGYTCGLWSLFHAAAANLPAEAEAGKGRGGKEGKEKEEEPLGQLWASAVRGWVRHFFTCSECAAHFESMASAETGGSAAVKSADEALLWAWRAHNRVNARLHEEEERGNGSSGDGVHLKVQWPPASLCPRCHREKRIGGGAGGDEEWDEGEVLAFLKEYYGSGGGKVSTSSSSSSSSLGRRVEPGAKRKKKESNDSPPGLASLAAASTPPKSSSSSTTSTALVLLVVFAFVAFGIAAGARAAPRAKKSLL